MGMNHYCVGNTCWICNPQPVGKVWDEMTADHIIPSEGLSGLVGNLLINIFKQGLGESVYLCYTADNNLTVQNLQAERKLVDEDSLEAILLDYLIEDYTWKTKDEEK